jgi:nitroreductase
MTREQAVAVLSEAARTGGYAPSIHNTQPWRWRVIGSTLELIVQRERQLTVTDPVRRLLTLSCGAALHHARVALAAEGWSARVDRLPDVLDRDLLARIHLGEHQPPGVDAARLAQAIRIRHTDRRPVPNLPIDPAILMDLRDIGRAEGAQLHLLEPDDIIELAAAAAHAQYVEAEDPAWREEIAYWAGGTRPDDVGVPDDVIPDQATRTTIPSRDFGAPGSLPVSSGHDRYARFAILYTDGDEPIDWLRGGEALSAVWLTATDKGLTVVPMSAAIELPPTRRALRGMLSELGQPLLVLRFGVKDTEDPGPPPTPRLPAEQVVEVLA